MNNTIITQKTASHIIDMSRD